MRKLAHAGLVGIVALAALVGREPLARACGGCFHEAPTPAKPVVESSIVSDHRMVFAISETQTVLWDQIRYNGDPAEFVWVLPVRPGARIELSRDPWIAALDATTRPQTVAPKQPSLGGFGVGGDGYSGGDEGVGCLACGSSTSLSAMSDSNAGSQSTDGGAAFAAPPPVQVVSQEVVGPYETVVVRSDQPKALETWLRDHGYAIPDSVLPIIDAYTAGKFDFVALRLRPGQGVRAMQPVRVVSQGADPTLPLRMVAAGVGANVGLTLYVIAEGRYRPRNFPEGRVDDTKLVWDFTQSRSNYQELSTAIMAGDAGRTWLTEAAVRPEIIGGTPSSTLVGASLYDTYYASCQGQLRDPAGPTSSDAGSSDAADAGDAGDPDAGTLVDDGGSPTAIDAGGSGQSSTPVSGLCVYGNELCCDFDDLEVALQGMHRSDVWLTRLRAELPASALSQDLVLEAHPDQLAVSNVHQAAAPTSTSSTASIAPRHRTRVGTGVTILGTALLVGRLVRRRNRRR